MALAKTFRAAACAVAAVALIVACGSSEDSTFYGVGDGLDGGGGPTGDFGTEKADASGQPTNVNCKKLTCADQGIECGPAGDGCGGKIDECGKCGAGLRCGGPGAPSKCVSPTVGTGCVPKTCTDLGITCGPAGDGCGGILQCGTCGPGQQCGVTGKPSQCVAATPTGPDGGACIAKTCADYKLENKDCGKQSDGCGNVIDCGGCIDPEFCGGGGPSKCAVSGGGACIPKTCADYPGKCGVQSDGCGGVTDVCGTCTFPQICGGGGVPSVCGGGTLTQADGGACQPKTVCAANQCGKIADGCGGVLDCGTANCVGGQICGGAGVPNVCGAPACVKTPQATACAGKNCGSVADGCGGLWSCGAGCVAPQICGGAGVPNVCGGGTITADGGANGGTCTPIAVCPANSCGPIANGCGGVLNCGNCISPAVCGGGGVPSQCGGGNQCTPTPQATACAGKNCGFMPDGCGGLWTCGVGAGACPGGGICGSDTPNVCGTLTGPCYTNGQSCFAGSDCCSGYCGSNRTCQATACVQDSPVKGACTQNAQCCSGLCQGGFCQPLTNVCRGSGNACAANTDCCSKSCVGGTCSSAVSFCRQTSDSCFDNSECCSGKCTKSGGNQNGICKDTNVTGIGNCLVAGTVTACAGAGPCEQACCSRACGSVGASPGYKVCQNPSGCHPVGELCQVNSDCCGWEGSPDPKAGAPQVCVKNNEADQYGRCGPGGASCKEPGLICKEGGDNSCSTANNCCETLGQPPNQNCNNHPENCCRLDALGIPRCLIRYVGDCTQPVPQGTECTSSADCCGKPCTFKDNLNKYTCDAACVADGGSCTNTQDCCGGACVKQPGSTKGTCEVPTCTKKTCADYPGTCGQQSDGCGGLTTNCGTCTLPQKCGGGGVPNQCGGTLCTAKTCPDLGAECGSVPDGCGNLLACGPCPDGTTCGGGGQAYKCGAASCLPKTCADQGVECGQTGDGCGNVITCDPCPAGTTCGGGGVPNKCGKPLCNPLTQCPAGKNCGDWPDGCGGSIHCGECAPNQTCGGGGSANVCGAASCTPKTCAQVGAQCGTASNGCGSVQPCGPCGPNEYCNPQNLCVGLTCVPKTCAMLGVQCGPTADGCGGILQCGDCPAGQGCGAGGVVGQCGKQECKPKTCAELGAVCGQVADGCGGLTPSCGDCAGALSCKNGACVTACTPITCAQVGANCGYIADGCGSAVNCGDCPAGQECGYGGKANVCGAYQPK